MTDQYVGEIRMFAGSYAPQDWFYCDGRELPISQYQALFVLIGTTYGGNGVTTFGLPDLRGRVPISRGQGTNLTNRILGEKAGTETVTLITAQLPTHTHAVNASTTAGTTSVAGPAVTLAKCTNTTGGTNVDARYIASGQPLGTQGNLNANAISASGGGQGHNNIMPVVALNYIISAVGIFPSPN